MHWMFYNSGEVLEMLEYKPNELDQDFVTCYSKYILAGDERIIIDDLEKLAEKGQKIKPSSILRSEMTLDFPETITEIMPCGERLCLMTEGHEEGKHLIIVNPEKGYITSVITFKEKNK